MRNMKNLHYDTSGILRVLFGNPSLFLRFVFFDMMTLSNLLRCDIMLLFVAICFHCVYCLLSSYIVGDFFCTRRKKILYAYKIFFLRDADNSASYIRFVIMLLANEHPLSFCHLRCHEKITKSWLILNTECTLKPNNLITFHEFLCVLCVLCVLIFFKPNCLE